MEIKRSNYIKFTEPYTQGPSDELKGIILFPTYSLNQLEYSNIIQRWENRESLIKNLTLKIQSCDPNWFNLYNEDPIKVPFLKITNKEPSIKLATDHFSTKGFKEDLIFIEEYRDLRGLHISNLHLKESPSSFFNSTAFDYCIIENCSFEKMTFFNCDFNHVWFVDTKFINCSIISNINHTLFISCLFENTKINNRFKFSSFSKNLFFMCNLNISLVEIDTSEFAFWGSDKIEILKYDYSTTGFDKAGAKVLGVLESHLSKKDYKTTKIEIYRDFKTYFIEMNKIFNENYTHDKFLESYYSYSLYDNITKSGYKSYLKYLFGKFVFAYGLKWQQPLKALIWLTITSSFVFLFSGVSLNRISIHRSFEFNISEFVNTLKDFFYCFYISFCSVLNVGLNLDKSTFIIDVFRSVLSFIGIILITIFTFNLVRRYIK